MQMRKRLQASPRRGGFAGLRSKPGRRRRDGGDLPVCGASQAGVAETGRREGRPLPYDETPVYAGNKIFAQNQLLKLLLPSFLLEEKNGACFSLKKSRQYKKGAEAAPFVLFIAVILISAALVCAIKSFALLLKKHLAALRAFFRRRHIPA